MSKLTFEHVLRARDASGRAVGQITERADGTSTVAVVRDGKPIELEASDDEIDIVAQMSAERRRRREAEATIDTSDPQEFDTPAAAEEAAPTVLRDVAQ